jgi:hypothetical protein
MKKIDLVLRDYVVKLPFDNLKYLAERFAERMGPDLSEAIEMCAKHPDIDRFFASASNYQEFWNAMDTVSTAIEKEYARRMPELVSNG